MLRNELISKYLLDSSANYGVTTFIMADVAEIYKNTEKNNAKQ